MPCPGLSLVGLICTVTVVLLINDSRGKETSLKNWKQSTDIRHHQDLHLGKCCDGVHISENEGKRKKLRKVPRWIKGLNRVKLKLTNIICKYDDKREYLNELYKGVTYCGVSNCGKYSNVLPEKMKRSEFNCEEFKELRDLRKRTLVILSKGYTGSKIYEDQFEKLIRRLGKNNGSRLKILRDFQAEIKVLREDISEVKRIKTKERLKPSETFHPKDQIRESQTYLKIREWGILQHSKEYLCVFCETLQLIYECWKGRKLGSKNFRKKETRKFSNKAKKSEGTTGQKNQK